MFGLCGATCTQGLSGWVLGPRQPGTAFPGEHCQLCSGIPHSSWIHIPWAFSVVLCEVEVLERERTEMPKVWLGGGKSSRNGTLGRGLKAPGYCFCWGGWRGASLPIPCSGLTFSMYYREPCDSPLALGNEIKS